MSQTKEGALKCAATKVGVSAEDYQYRLDIGMKYCSGCKAWQWRKEFAVDRSRGDGLAAQCSDFRNRRQRGKYVKKPKRVYSWVVPTRGGDKLQARARVNGLVAKGELPHPNTVPCFECGAEWFRGSRRHSYHHHQGYGPDKQLVVIPLCSICHAHADKTWETRDKSTYRNGAECSKRTGAFRGDRNPSAKLTWQVVRSIRWDAEFGIKDVELVEKYKISRSQIRNIRTNKCWIEREGNDVNTNR